MQRNWPVRESVRSARQIWHSKLPARLPVCNELPRYLWHAANHDDLLRVDCFSRRSVVKRAGFNGISVYDEHFVVVYVEMVIGSKLYPLLTTRRMAVSLVLPWFRFLSTTMHTSTHTLVCSYQRLCDVLGLKGVGQHLDAGLCAGNRVQYQLSCCAFG